MRAATMRMAWMTTWSVGRLLLAIGLVVGCGLLVYAQKDDGPPKQPDVVWVPTPHEVVDKMLEMAEVKRGDLVYDLGCGDGRIVVAAAKRYGTKAKGFEIDPDRVELSQGNVKGNHIEDLATIEQADIFDLDLSKADVVTLYLLPALNVRLVPQLKKLKDGSRIVSHDFDMKGYKPEKQAAVEVEGQTHKIYMWRTPLVHE